MVNGVHDVGGMDRFGAVAPPENEPLFRAEWEKTAYALFSMCFRAGIFELDSFRYGIETMSPVDYLTSPYYEHWVHTAEYHAITRGKIDAEELERRYQHYLANPDAPLPDHGPSPELVQFVDAIVAAGAPAQRPVDREPKYKVGQRVRVTDAVPTGHTRSARYVRGRSGEIAIQHGSFIFPDTAAHSLGENPEYVYAIKFHNEELWGAEAAEPNGVVYFDVWEPYISIDEGDIK